MNKTFVWCILAVILIGLMGCAQVARKSTTDRPAQSGTFDARRSAHDLDLMKYCGDAVKYQDEGDSGAEKNRLYGECLTQMGAQVI